MSTLKISVEASLETNDHQARLVVDQKDWLGENFLGLDPPMLCNQLTSGENEMIVARCACGAVGCSDMIVKIVREDDVVKWHVDGGETLVFDAAPYDAEIDRFSRDKTWETIERAAEREINSILRGTSLKHGFKFEWASTRIRKGFVILSYGKPAKNRVQQKLLEIEWDGLSVGSAIDCALAFRAKRFPHLPGGVHSNT